MDRREFLATGAALAIGVTGGCTGCARSPSASLEMEPVTDAEIARRVTHRLEADGDSERSRLVSSAVENGSATREGTEPRLPENGTFVHDGSIYRLSREVVESRPATSFSFTLNPVEGSVDGSETVDYADLPAVDRRKFAERGWADGGFLGFGSSLLYLDPEIPDSALVPEPKRPVIVWDDETRGRFEVDGARDTALRTYRYAAERVHPDVAAYGRDVRERYEFALSGLSSGERRIVEEAIGGNESDEENGGRGYVIPPDEEPPRAMRELAERFRGREEVRRVWEESGARERSASGEYLVRYGGEVYWTQVFIVPEGGTETAE